MADKKNKIISSPAPVKLDNINPELAKQILQSLDKIVKDLETK